MTLQLAVKAMNNTMGPEGLVPSYLVFESIPRFPVVDSRTSNGMATIAAELRIKTALASRFSYNADL